MNICLIAGGRITDDVLKSMLFGTAMAGLEEIYVVHHNDCGESPTASYCSVLNWNDLDEYR